MSRMRSYAWIFIFLCIANFCTTLAHQGSEIVRSKELSISSEEFPFSNFMDKKHDSEHVRQLTAAAAAEDEISLIGKGQKGKGASGGSNNAHRPGAKSAAAESFCRHLFFTLSTAILVFSSFVP